MRLPHDPDHGRVFWFARGKTPGIGAVYFGANRDVHGARNFCREFGRNFRVLERVACRARGGRDFFLSLWIAFFFFAAPRFFATSFRRHAALDLGRRLGTRYRVRARRIPVQYTRFGGRALVDRDRRLILARARADARVFRGVLPDIFVTERGCRQSQAFAALGAMDDLGAPFEQRFARRLRRLLFADVIRD